MSERQTKAGNQITLSLSHSLTVSHSLIHSLSSYWTTFVFMSMLKSHSLTLTLSHSLILSFSHSLIHSLSLDMLNNFCFHVYAQKSLSHSFTTFATFTTFTTFNLSFNHSRHAEQVLFSCLGSKDPLSLSHSLTLTLSHSHTLTLSHSRTLALSHSHTLSFTLSTCWQP